MSLDMKNKNSSEIIAASLRRVGCKFAFGIPGGEVLMLIDAMNREGISIELARHENCAGFMAEGTWHTTSAPAILFATIGPGVTNAVNAIANAYQDRVPMIVLTGCVSDLDQQTYTHQVIDHVDLLKPVSKACFRVANGTAAVVIEKALAIAMEGRPGPVIIDVPVDVQRHRQENWHCMAETTQEISVPSGQTFEDAKEELHNADRPLVIAGVDAVNQSAGEAVQRFCDTFNAPLITTYKAKGLIAEDQALAMGGAGLSPLCDRELLPLVQASDCVVMAGYDPIEMRTGWRDPFRQDQTSIDIAAVANTHFMHRANYEFVADVSATLGLLCDGGADIARESNWPDDEPKQTKQALIEAMRRHEAWGPAAITDECRKVCPRETIASADSGAHRIVLSQIWECYEPRGLLQSSGFCTMGCAIPLAIGRKLAEPERPTIAFVGDAGLEMFLGELLTIRDRRLCIPIVVFVDSQLALIELKQRNSGMENLAVDFERTNYGAVAEALGGHSASVDNRSDLSLALSNALKKTSFTLILAEIGKNAYDDRI